MEHLKVCPICGREFRTKYDQRKYCGNECLKKADKYRKEQYKSIEKVKAAEARRPTSKTWLDKFNDHIHKNGGVYHQRKGWGY